MAGSLEDGMPVSLPDDLEFFEAISDCSNVVIRAAGGQMSAYSSILLEQSPVFRAKLSKFTAGIPDSDLVVEDGKVILKLDCSYDTAQALFAFITSKGQQVLDKAASPAMLRQLAVVADEWQVQPLLDMVDKVLANQMRADMERFRRSDAKTWQYAGSHVRERSIQMLKLALQAGLKDLQSEAEMFVAANWLFLSEDNRLAKDLEITSLCRIHRLAEFLQQSSEATYLGDSLPGTRCSKRQTWGHNNTKRPHCRSAKTR